MAILELPLLLIEVLLRDILMLPARLELADDDGDAAAWLLLVSLPGEIALLDLAPPGLLPARDVLFLATLVCLVNRPALVALPDSVFVVALVLLLLLVMLEDAFRACPGEPLMVELFMLF
jgi:hypothetical protein